MFTYNGLTMDEMSRICEYYRVASTAEYVMENYNISDEDAALKIGHDVRRLMDKYGYTEDEAIMEVIK